MAREEGKEDVVAKILAIIKREQDRAFWRKLNYTCGKVKVCQRWKPNIGTGRRTR